MHTQLLSDFAQRIRLSGQRWARLCLCLALVCLPLGQPARAQTVQPADDDAGAAPSATHTLYLPQLFVPGPATAPPSPTVTGTRTATATRTATPSVTRTPTVTGTRTPSPTVTGTRTPSPTVTGTRTATATRTATPSVTRTPSPTITGTRTATATATRTLTPSVTRTPSATATATDEPTSTATATATNEPTSTATASTTATASATPTSSPTRTTTPTSSPTVPANPGGFVDIVWEELGEQARPPEGNSEGQSAVLNNKLYSFSGFGNNYGPKSWTWAFDPTSGTQGRWSDGTVAEMPPMRDGTPYGGATHMGFATDGRYVYFASGYAAGSTGSNGQASTQVFGTNYVLRYDSQSNSYERLPNLPAVRAAGSLAIADGWLHYFGGTNQARTLETPEHWAIQLSGINNNQWQARAPLPEARHHMAAISHNGKIYAIGGQKGHDGGLISQSWVHMYDPATNTWAEKAPMLQPRNHMGSSTVLIGDKIVVVGGQSNHNNERPEVFVYDISANQWSQISSLPGGRHSAVAGFINGKIYLANGPTDYGDPTIFKNRFTLRGTLVFSQAEAEALRAEIAARRPAALPVAYRAADAAAEFFLCAAPEQEQGEPEPAPDARLIALAPARPRARRGGRTHRPRQSR